MNMKKFNILALLVLCVLCIPPLVSGMMPGMDPQHGGEYSNVSAGSIPGSVSLPQDETGPSPLAPVQLSIQDPTAIAPTPKGFADSSNSALHNTLSQGRISKTRYDILTDTRTGQKYGKDRVIVRFKSQKNAGVSLSPEKIRVAHANVGATVEKDLSTGSSTRLQLVQLPNGTDVQSAIAAYESNPEVLYAEPDYVLSIVPDQAGSGITTLPSAQTLSIPSDSDFSSQWSFHNTGQTGGTPGADIAAPAAWNLSTGSDSIVVAVIDTGVQYTHRDLSANIWNNTDEIPGNALDDDGNGYVDDVRGWNFVNNTPDPKDDNSHGTHVSGTIGAVGNNALGVAGVNWHVRIMPLKALDRDGIGLTSDLISAIEYANANGASVISNSWGGGSKNQALNDTLAASTAVVVCAAGNYGDNNDLTPFYPASYSGNNIIAVAATDHSDVLESYSNYGLNSVDLAAPGMNIYSTTLEGNYSLKSGTSMATPHVSGVVALIKAVNPSLNALQIKTIILSTVDSKPSLTGKVVSGGRLNAYKALVTTPPVLNASFTANTTAGTAPLAVQFTDTSNGTTPTAWNWSFKNVTGNNTEVWWSTEQHPQKTFGPGNYSIVLNASNALGYNRSPKVTFVNVTVIPPVSSFTVNVTNGTAPLAVNFTDTSANAPTAWIWLFTNVTGNLTPVVWSTDQSPAHTFGVGNYSIVLYASNSAGNNLSSQVTFINVSPVVTSKMGIFRPATGIWSLDSNGNSARDVSDKSLSWGLPGDVPVIGDWNGDGRDDIGIFRPTAGIWSLDSNGNFAWEVSDKSLSWGLPHDEPVIGDWNGDGKDDLGIFRPSSGIWSLDSNGNVTWEVSDKSLSWGLPYDEPVIGDWNGDGKDDIGIFRPSSGIWSLDSNGNFAWEVSDKSLSWGLPYDEPVIGDWNGNGTTKIGIFRPSSGIWSLDSNGNYKWEVSDTSLSWGLPNDKPVVGKY